MPGRGARPAGPSGETGILLPSPDVRRDAYSRLADLVERHIEEIRDLRVAPDSSYEQLEKSLLRSAGVEVFFGSAAFVGPRTVAVDGRQLTFRRAVIATGTREPPAPASSRPAAAASAIMPTMTPAAEHSPVRVPG